MAFGDPFSIIKAEFISQALQAGFTEEQAEFMWEWLYRAGG